MPRLKEYEPSDALEKAIKAFWRNGYAATTVRDLEKAMGVNRFGIQTFFGGKDELFEACLDKYLVGACEDYFADIPRNGLGSIQAFFETLSDPDQVPSECSFGCLLINTLTEPIQPNNPQIRPQMRRFLDAMRDAFRGALATSNESGELRADLNRNACADFLVTLVLGMHTTNRSAHSISASQTTAEVLRVVLDSWRK